MHEPTFIAAKRHASLCSHIFTFTLFLVKVAQLTFHAQLHFLADERVILEELITDKIKRNIVCQMLNIDICMQWLFEDVFRIIPN